MNLTSSGPALSQQNQFHQTRLNPCIIRVQLKPCLDSLQTVDFIILFRTNNLKKTLLEYSIGQPRYRRPTIVGNTVRPVALRPRLSTGMPLQAKLCRMQ